MKKPGQMDKWVLSAIVMIVVGCICLFAVMISVDNRMAKKREAQEAYPAQPQGLTETTYTADMPLNYNFF